LLPGGRAASHRDVTGRGVLTPEEGIYIYIYIYILSHTYITTGKLADALRVDELHDKVQQHESYIYTTTYAHTHNNPHA